MKLRLLGGQEGRSSNVSPEKCINLFYEKGANAESLVSVAGSSLFVDLGNGEVRGGIAYNDLAYFVMGNTLYEVNSAGTATSRGTLNTQTGRVSMAHNGVRDSATQEIFIADGTQRYIYDNNTQTLTGYTDYAATTVTFVDGYFVFTIADSDRIYYTELYDGVTVGASNFFTFEGSPDEATTIISDQRELFGFGQKTLEVWYNTDDTDNTFQRFQGGFKETGSAAVFSPAKVDNNIYWLSRNDRGQGQVMRLGQNYQPQVASTPEMDYQIAQYDTITDAFGYSYQYEGHEYYVLTFPSAKRTWVYDAATQNWHQRGHTINGEFPNRERYNCHVFAFGKHLFGDMTSGAIFELDSDLSTLNGERIPKELITPNIEEEERRLRVSQVQLDMEEGVGDSNEDDTSMWLSYSKDGGHTYSSEVERSIGDLGSYKKRVIWRRLGQGRNWTFRIRTWTPKRVILKSLNVRPYGE